MVDSCPTHLSEEEISHMLMDNFNRHYNSNKAPFGLYFHTIWFKDKQNLRVLLRFLDELANNKVSNSNFNKIICINSFTLVSLGCLDCDKLSSD